MGIRPATNDDLGWMMSLCELGRIQKNSLHPIAYQQPAAYCRTRRKEIERILENPNSLCLISEHHDQPLAFLVALLVDAPPVYAPGGPVCLIEEFEGVKHQDLATHGLQLLDEARNIARRRGAVLQRVISSAGDLDREEFLLGNGFTVASEWYYGRNAKVRHAPSVPGVIRKAQPSDLPVIFSLAEKRRHRYEQYQPVFWRAASISIEAVAPWLTGQIEAEENIALVHETRRGIDGYLIAMRDYIDDFDVANVERWPTIGAALLAEASRLAVDKGPENFLIVCAHLDQYKRATIAELGFELITNWYVRNF